MGVEKLPIRFPSEAPPWFVQFMQWFIRDVLSKLDIRNATGIGVDVSGNSNETATISLGSEIQDLADADFVLAEVDPSLPNARTIAGETGVLEVEDSGPGGQVTVKVTVHGLTLDKLAQIPATSVLGNATGSADDVWVLPATTDDTALQRVGGVLVWAALPVGANPSASVGLSAVNGSASTFMRSDAAPALSQSITPTWLGLHVFSAGAQVTGSASNATGLNLKYSGGIGTVRAHNGSNATLNLESEAGIALEVGGNTALSVATNRRVAIAAPSSGTTLQLTAVSAGTAISASDGTVTATWTFAGTALNLGTTSNHALNLVANNATRLSLSTSGVLTLANYTAGALFSDGSGVVSSGTLGVALGGSGATTLTGYLKGNGTSAFTASSTIPYSDITGGPSAYTPAALTKTDDTNVTLTLGGTPATALLQATSLTLGWTGTLAVARGGSGAGTLTGYLKGNGTSAFTASSTIPYSDISGTPSVPTLDHGTYTPTITGVANVSGSTAYTCQYLRVGNTVTVSGKVSIQTSAAVTTRFRLSLPVASNFAAEENAGGALSGATLSGRLFADSTNDAAEGIFGATGGSTFDFSFHFTYRVI